MLCMTWSYHCDWKWWNKIFQGYQVHQFWTAIQSFTDLISLPHLTAHESGKADCCSKRMQVVAQQYFYCSNHVLQIHRNYVPLGITLLVSTVLKFTFLSYVLVSCLFNRHIWTADTFSLWALTLSVLSSM